jgi:hypothetical protein
VSAPVPPLAVVVAEPFVFPQVAGVDVALALIAVAGCVTEAVCVVLQPLLSVTVTVYVPAQSALAVAALPPDGAQL